MNSILRLGAVAAALTALTGVSAVGQVSTRTLVFDRKVAIVDRLIPGDVNVVIKRLPTTPLVANPAVRESFEDEIRRLSTYDTIAVVEISDSQGETVEGGTWIRTRIRGRANHLVKPGPLVDYNGFVEFWEDGGRTQIGSVSVTAEPYVEFTAQHNYLVFLRTDRNRGTTYAAFAFAIDSQGVLRPMKRSDGAPVVPTSNLIGRNVAAVSAAIAQPR